MNRAQRRNLKRVVAHAIKGKPGLAHPVPDSVVLHGGPMDGWVVKPDAPALKPDWRELYLEAAAIGLYQPKPGDPAWSQLSDFEKDQFHALARSQHGAGHYELRGKGQAEWVPEQRVTERATQPSVE